MRVMTVSKICISHYSLCHSSKDIENVNGKSNKNLSILCVDPVIIETGMWHVASIQWNHCGSVLAIAGNRSCGAEKEINIVHFYTPFGDVSTENFVILHSTTIMPNVVYALM